MNNIFYPDFKYVESPNLPKNKVKLLFADERLSNKCENELIRLNIGVCKINKSKNYAFPVSAHADLRLCHISGDLWYFNGKLINIDANSIEARNFDVEDREELRYPYDVKCNCVFISQHIICNEQYTDSIIINYANNHDISLINVKQGYTKCSTVVVNENSIITEDYGIHEKATKCSLNSLFIKSREVRLDGYNYGFIGGSGVLLNKNLLAFCGRIKSHSEYKNIKSFCRNINIDVYSLSDEPLYDYGSLLPIAEEA